MSESTGRQVPRRAPTRRVREGLTRCWVSVALSLVMTGCLATPLPTPPTADPSRMSLTAGAQPGEVDLVGGPGAIDGDIIRLRVSSSLGTEQVTVAPDGSFAVRSLLAADPATLFLEALSRDRERFVIAVTAGAAGAAIETSPGTDRDADGSPDAIDCAPDDGALEGRRCTARDADVDDDGVCAVGEDTDDNGDCLGATEDTAAWDCDEGESRVHTGAAEVCDGLDNDCDGAIDDACVACANDSDCPVSMTCSGGVCMP